MVFCYTLFPKYQARCKISMLNPTMSYERGWVVKKYVTKKTTWFEHESLYNVESTLGHRRGRGKRKVERGYEPSFAHYI